MAADCTVLVTLPGTGLQEFELDKSASRLAEDHMEQVAKQVTNLSIAYIWTLPNCYAHRRSCMQRLPHRLYLLQLCIHVHRIL